MAAEGKTTEPKQEPNKVVVEANPEPPLKYKVIQFISMIIY